MEKVNCTMEKNSTTHKYQLMFYDGQTANNAGYKAPQDVVTAVSELGFQEIAIDVSYRSAANKICAGLHYIKAIFQCVATLVKIKRDSVLFVQSGTGGGAVRDYVLRKLKESKKVRIITLFHDVEALRGQKIKGEASFFNLILELSDGIIVHNDRMKEWFIKKDVYKKNIVALEIFDYIFTPEGRNRHLKKQVIIAGNLSPEKVKYIGKIKDLDSSFVLYGSNYDASAGGNNITYKGSFPPDKLPHILEDGFGLIWDGTTTETCSGTYGEYLRYNNPHKLSLYLASGLPVFIWKEAAEAEFVERNGVGYTISSLSDISTILECVTEDEYRRLCKRVDSISSRLINGYYTKAAVTRLLEMLD